MSLSKCVILVDDGVNVRHFPTVLKSIHRHFNPREDFILLPGTAQDTLDFTGEKMNYGSKMILDATGGDRPHAVPRVAEKRLVEDIKHADKHIVDLVSWEDSLLLVQVKGSGKDIVQKLIKHPELSEFNIIAAVSEDVPLQNPTLALWGLFTRFDCERDIFFADCKLQGVKPVYSGLMGIDATWKPAYPNPVEMLPSIMDQVTERWKDYGL
jgi:3-polyprenyl-4-hydroxybenzoate decarboxylase